MLNVVCQTALSNMEPGRLHSKLLPTRLETTLKVVWQTALSNKELGRLHLRLLPSRLKATPKVVRPTNKEPGRGLSKLFNCHYHQKA